MQILQEFFLWSCLLTIAPPLMRVKSQIFRIIKIKGFIMNNQTLTLLLIIPGFWLAWKFVSVFNNWIHKKYNHPLSISKTQRSIFWLTIGSLFSIALIRLYAIIYTLLSMIINPGWCNSQPNMMTKFGSVSFCVYNLPSIIIFLLIFGLVFFICYDNFNKSTKTENFFLFLIILTITTIINQVVFLLFSQLLWSPA